MEAEFTSGSSISGMMVPREALMNENRIYVLENGQIEEREVTVVDRMEDQYIIQGYLEGDAVVVESLVDVKPGQAAAPIS